MSSRRLHFIVNPAAGRGRGGRTAPLIEESMAKAGAGFELSLTSGPGDAVKLAALAAKEADVVVAVGGDGTVSEVVNGLRDSGKALGILPVGSGNDFVKVVGIPTDPREALEAILRGGERRVDLGVVNDRLYTNSVGIGIDAAVARTMNRSRRLPGQLAYYWGVALNLFFYRCRPIRWQADDESGETKSLLAAVMNGTTYGGSFHVAPKAVCDDGLLDLVIAGSFGIVGRARKLPVFKKGRHLDMPQVTWRRARRISIRSDWPLPIQADGDLLPDSNSGTEVEIEVIPGGLRVLTGGGRS